MSTSLAGTARLLAAGLRALLALTLLTGLLYPLAVTGAAQALFEDEANGSRVEADGRTVGSSLIGRQDYGPGYFQPRPARGLGRNTVNTQYDLILSGATHLAADNPELTEWVERARARVAEENSVPGHPVSAAQVPADAVTSSGSGLDPHISPAYAMLQARRVAAHHSLPVARVQRLVRDHAEGRTLGFIGEPRVNVLRLNLALGDLVKHR